MRVVAAGRGRGLDAPQATPSCSGLKVCDASEGPADCRFAIKTAGAGQHPPLLPARVPGDGVSA